jgi:hypothetical protein
MLLHRGLHRIEPQGPLFRFDLLDLQFEIHRGAVAIGLVWDDVAAYLLDACRLI